MDRRSGRSKLHDGKLANLEPGPEVAAKADDEVFKRLTHEARRLVGRHANSIEYVPNRTSPSVHSSGQSTHFSWQVECRRS